MIFGFKITTFDGKRVKPRGDIAPGSALMAKHVAQSLGDKFTLEYMDYKFECTFEKVAYAAPKVDEHYVPRCIEGCGTLAGTTPNLIPTFAQCQIRFLTHIIGSLHVVAKTDLQPGATPKEAAASDPTHVNRHLIQMRFGKNSSNNQKPRELPKLLMHTSASNAEYWAILDKRMTLALI